MGSNVVGHIQTNVQLVSQVGENFQHGLSDLLFYR